ncbi:MAG TPA: alkaline phosphatase family protein [Steroidobacteraceae bacterium]|nr:alkaline phosphatase family protein [Steroidobacteraceae bacterium]
MISKQGRLMAAVALACNVALATPMSVLAANNWAERAETTTPIKHVIVIFNENISFDHYFGTYPYATNPSGEPVFHALPDTPRVNNLRGGGLLDQNPNSTQPFRMDTGLASVTCDQNHGYTAEQQATDHGLMDQFPQFAGSASASCNSYGKGTGVVMGYFDGNTVTALWNYAQHYSMSDNSYGTTYGPSTVGALNLIAGTTNTATLVALKPNGSPASAAGSIANGATSGPAIGDPRPGGDECVLTNPALQGASMITVAGKNVGDLLNAKGLTWGWFQGGFAPTGYDSKGRAICGAHHAGLAGDDAIATVGDYIPHHQPFQYFASTQNPQHVQPKDPALIGTSTDGANHQYDLSAFWTALGEDKLPSVTYLKAAAYQDAHPGYSDPIDEQAFVVGVVNAVQNSRYWNDTAIIIAYDDSDGWYDHVLGPVVNQSAASDDALVGTGNCGSAGAATQGRCGYGPRLPLLVISPYAKQNYVDHRTTDQASILRFIEDNWDLGRIGGDSSDVKAGTLDGLFDFREERHASRLILDPATGVELSH